MGDLSTVDAKHGRLRRVLARLRGAADGPAPRGRAWKRVAIASAALVLLAVATTQVHVRGRWYGLYLLRSTSGRPLELKDDLKLGDGPRLLWGTALELRRSRVVADDRIPRLELEWDAEDGSGAVSSVLDGARVEIYFSRYQDDEGKTPAGLFVGGAPAEIVAGTNQDESGVALRDARGWHHVWCSVNEGLLVGPEGRMYFPSDWAFRGSEVLVNAPERVVLHSVHDLATGPTHLRMDRFAYFKAGRAFFRLGVNILNLGEAPTTISYAYGDDPWVGRFGSSAGNVGWNEEGIVTKASWMSTASNRWAGILDTGTGLANFISWQDSPPDGAYFGNHPGSPRPTELGDALTSNEVSIGLEWRNRTLQPGERLSVQLTIGVAPHDAAGMPAIPAEALRRR